MHQVNIHHSRTQCPCSALAAPVRLQSEDMVLVYLCVHGSLLLHKWPCGIRSRASARVSIHDSAGLNASVRSQYLLRAAPITHQLIQLALNLVAYSNRCNAATSSSLCSSSTSKSATCVGFHGASLDPSHSPLHHFISASQNVWSCTCKHGKSYKGRRHLSPRSSATHSAIVLALSSVHQAYCHDVRRHSRK